LAVAAVRKLVWGHPTRVCTRRLAFAVVAGVLAGALELAVWHDWLGAHHRLPALLISLVAILVACAAALMHLRGATPAERWRMRPLAAWLAPLTVALAAIGSALAVTGALRAGMLPLATYACFATAAFCAAGTVGHLLASPAART